MYNNTLVVVRRILSFYILTFMISPLLSTRLVAVPYIIGGSTPFQGEYPWLVSIRYFDSPICGGTILNENYILTAAHCTRYFSSKYKITAGEHSLIKDEDSEQVRSILEVKIHPGFNIGNLENDVALIKVNESFTFNKFVQPGKIANASFIPDEKLIAVGWGLEWEGDPHVSKELKQVGIRLLSKEKCKKRLSLVKGIKYSPGVFCAGGVNGKGTCFGDSGSPIHSGNIVYGLSSATAVCGQEDSPAIFTKISYFMKWIKPRIFN